MRELFKPLRRKCGVVTLFLACVLSAFWMRSWYVTEFIDFIPIRVDEHSYDSLISCRWGMGWVRHRYRSLKVPVRRMTWRSERKPSTDPAPICHIVPFGFRYPTDESSDPHTDGYFVPYSIFTIPLTVLSAWLLLSKVRPKQTVNPTQNGSVNHG
jgi:hypothetical protein